MKENFNENSNQNINIPKGGDSGMENLIEEIKTRIEKEGLWAADELFTTEEVTEENREKFNKIWKEVWQESEYDQGDIEKTERHYKEYEGNSKDIILFVKTNEGEKVPIGTIRLIRDEGRGLVAFNDFKVDKDLTNKKCIEFTLLTILPSWRGLKHVNSFLLFREGYRYMKKENAENIVLVTGEDENLLKIFRGVGFPVQKVSETKKYEGGNCAVYTIPIKEVEIQIQKSSLELTKWFTRGVDLSKVAKPEEE